MKNTLDSWPADGFDTSFTCVHVGMDCVLLTQIPRTLMNMNAARFGRSCAASVSHYVYCSIRVSHDYMDLFVRLNQDLQSL